MDKWRTHVLQYRRGGMAMERRTLGRESLGERWRWYGMLVGCLLAAYLAIWMFTEKTPFRHTPYCSYALQAQRWMEGHLDLGQDYPWLELAIYDGKYYVSFPPLPTLIVLPFVALFGVDGTPEYFITTVMSLIGAVQLLRLCNLYCEDRRKALLWTLLATIGSNFLLIGYNGDVWLMAQTAAFMFTSAALYTAATDREGDGKWPLLWLACAVGCRPFNIAYLPVVAWLLVEKFRKNGLTVGDALRRHWLWLAPPACVGGFYMALNQLRFGNPFQFGHDYLPEFTRSPDHVQFALSNIPWNFTGKLFALPRWEDGWLRFPKGGFAFFITSPIYGVGMLYLVRRLTGRLRGEAWGKGALTAVIGVCVSLHLLALCAHGSMGGIQWGLRYTIDAIPAVALGILLLRRPEGEALDGLLPPALVFGLCLNLVGTLAILNDWNIFL